MLTGFSIPTFLSLFARTTAWASLCPYIGDKMVPGKIRMAACVLFAAALVGARPTQEWNALWLALPTDVAIGLLAGAAVKMVIAGAQAAGQLVGLQLELSFASNYDPLMKEDALPTARIAYVLAGLAFLGTGGFESSLRLLATQNGTMLAGPDLLTQALHLVGATSSLALGLAGPVLCATLVANLSMGLASRAAPALNVFSVVLACVLVLGGGVLVGTAPTFTHGLFGIARFATEAPNAFFR